MLRYRLSKSKEISKAITNKLKLLQSIRTTRKFKNRIRQFIIRSP